MSNYSAFNGLNRTVPRAPKVDRRPDGCPECAAKMTLEMCQAMGQAAARVGAMTATIIDQYLNVYHAQSHPGHNPAGDTNNIAA